LGRPAFFAGARLFGAEGLDGVDGWWDGGTFDGTPDSGED